VWVRLDRRDYAGGPTKETEFEKLVEPGFIARTKGRNGGGHVLAVTSAPAARLPVVRHMEQARDVIGGASSRATRHRGPAGGARLGAHQSAVRDAARRALARAEELGFDELLRRHRAAWDERWRDADLVVDGDAGDQEALRFSIYHMISTAHPTKDTVSVAPAAWAA